MRAKGTKAGGSGEDVKNRKCGLLDAYGRPIDHAAAQVVILRFDARTGNVPSVVDKVTMSIFTPTTPPHPSIILLSTIHSLDTDRVLKQGVLHPPTP